MGDREVLDEMGKWEKVVRHGKLQKKLICPDGYKAEDGKCVRMSAKERMVRAKQGRKMATQGKGSRAGAILKRERSMKRFHRND